MQWSENGWGPGRTGTGESNGAAQLHHSRVLMTTLGLLALSVGTLIYVFDRSATAVYFVPDASTLAQSTPLLFGVMGNYLPAFLHVLAFALFSNAIAGRHYLGMICVSWFVIEVVFEVAQINPIAIRIAGVLPGWFAGYPILENIPSHFVTGHFDTMDMLFLLLGCVTAFAIGYKTLPHCYCGARSLRIVGLLFVVLTGLTSIVSSGGTGAA